MPLSSQVAIDPPAARRFRRLAPLVILLALVALIMAPGFLG